MRFSSRGGRIAGAGALVSVLAGCGTSPPASRVPTARAALDRVHATQDCGLGVQVTAKVDHFGKQGRVRGDMYVYGVWPALLRMEIASPFGLMLATLTSDATTFALSDLRDKRFYFGPPSACNIARLTTVPMPDHVLVSLLRGEAPILKHDPANATIEWSRKGYYVVQIRSTREAFEEIHLAPHPQDYGLPWDKQRMRVVDVEVKQQDIVLYHASLEDHQSGRTAPARVDPAGIDPPMSPSGPMCTAEVPRRIQLEVPGTDQDVRFRYDKVLWNPPLYDGLFSQPIPGGVEVVRVTCDRE